MNNLKLIPIIFSIAINIAYAKEYQIDQTIDKIAKKALIIQKDAKLFESSKSWWLGGSNKGSDADFMELYFLMKPKKTTWVTNWVSKFRMPVLKQYSLKNDQPDGWLEKKSYVPWHTMQLIQFQPKLERQLIKVYATAECAKQYGISGKTSKDCKILGEEPVQNSASKLLIPVFQRQKHIYQGGFIRISKNKQPVKLKHQNTPTGYDLVFVIDTTRSMGIYFQPIVNVLQSFLKTIPNRTINIGVLFYRDRKFNDDCDIGYITNWAQNLTTNSNKVIQVLNNAEATWCDSEDEAEAVFDAVHRAIIDTQWNKNHFKRIILIGDAPPNYDKNPMNFSTASIIEEAKSKGIRLLTFKIGSKTDADIQEFEELANVNNGQYHHITRADINQFKSKLTKVFIQEWTEFQKTKRNYAASRLPEYELPVIIGEPNKQNRDFVIGWVPRQIQNQLAFKEYIFMRQVDLKLHILLLESIILAANAGIAGGEEDFLDILRQMLAVHLKSKNIFQGDETLTEVIAKTHFTIKTELFSFTPAEVKHWKVDDYTRLNKLLNSKLRLLQRFFNSKNNVHKFNGVAYLYIPKEYFP